MQDETQCQVPAAPLSGAGRFDVSARGAVGVIGVVVLYFYGVHYAYPTSPNCQSLAKWIWHACNLKNDTIHGLFVPLISAAMCWVSAKQARHEISRPSVWGLVGVGLGIAFYLFSVRTIQPRLAIIGLPFLMLGILTYLHGFRYAKHFVFPAFIWYFAMPIPGTVQATTMLQLVVTKVCFKCGLMLGMPLVLDGNSISAVGENAWDLNIAEGCSGIRSLMALALISAIYANYTQKVLWKKVVLFACALPLSMVGNFGRIFTILVLSDLGFKDFAAQTYHDWAGMLIFFPIALAGLYVVDWLLNLRGRTRRKLVRKTIVGEGEAPSQGV